MSDKKYYIGRDENSYEEGMTLYYYYDEALQAKDQVEKIMGGKYRIYKIETKVSEATHVTEDYREW